ncbi:hypothetical protein BCR36DRAFT_409884 [Piromyces finnis]|uniref:SUN domain-containing protein n=1 Tax=Piromyces finnis TaxID=1754191 RepID=A0A1Y1VI58_9FUNG|nr:hypothetical protein BCR36DRAFT_409884 [Piromyces finnis]|eukprot:ORX56700.1 hypothetical protein BCR36DRAFT_409884 [Piromyces finnis]
MSFGGHSYNFDVFNTNQKNKNGFSYSKRSPFQRIDNMDIDIPSKNENSFPYQFNSMNTNYQNFHPNNPFQKEIHPLSFQNSSNYIKTNTVFNSENKSNNQFHFSKNTETQNFSIISNKNNNSNFSTNKRIKFSIDKSTSSFPNSLNWNFQKQRQDNIKDTFKTPASLNSNFQRNNSSVSKFNIYTINRQNDILSSNKSLEHSFLIRQQERIAIRENNNSNVIQKFSYINYILKKIKNILNIPLKLLNLSLNINWSLIFAIIVTTLIFYLNDSPGMIIKKFLQQYNINFKSENFINIGITFLLIIIFLITVGVFIINTLFIKPSIIYNFDNNNKNLLNIDKSSDLLNLNLKTYNEYFNNFIHNNYISSLIDFIIYKPIRRNEDRRKIKNIEKKLLKFENNIKIIKSRLNYKSNRIHEISKIHEDNKNSFEIINYYLTIYENIFKYNSLHLEQQKAILKQIENNFNYQFENIINTRKKLDNLSKKIDDLFSKSRNMLNNEIGNVEEDKISFIENYIRELDNLFPPQILITWNQNNNEIEFSTDLYNTIGQRYFSKKDYNKHFNVQYPIAPTLPLKEFLWKNKELVEDLMLKNFNTYTSKKSEIIIQLKENIDYFRKQFKNNENIILSSIDKNEFLNSIKSFIISDVKNRIKEKERNHSLQKYNQYSTHSIPDYSTALYGASIIESLTTKTQPITSENHMINRLHIINNPPLLALENSLLPNSCWAMKGTSGSIGIELSHFIYPTSITIEHLPSWNTRDPMSAPRSMTLVAISGSQNVLKKIDSNRIKNINEIKSSSNNNNINNQFLNQNEEIENHKINIKQYLKKVEFPLILGTFQYNISGPQSSQTFPLNQNAINRLKLYDTKINKVQLQIHNNWGNENYTCIYRIRIHGDEPQTSQSPLMPL